MARTGRKQLSVQIKEESFSKFEQIKAETGLSNAKLVEMLIQNYESINTKLEESINTNTNINTNLEDSLRKIVREELKSINTNTNINTKSTSTSTNTEEEWEDDEPMIDLAPELPIPSTEDFYGKIEESKLSSNDYEEMFRLMPDEEPEPKPKRLSPEDFF